jgi:hypothetical protein
MKTVIQELIEGCKGRLVDLDNVIKDEDADLKVRARSEVKYFECLITLQSLEKALPKEREQIEQAYRMGKLENISELPKQSAQEYFKQTYTL